MQRTPLCLIRDGSIVALSIVIMMSIRKILEIFAILEEMFEAVKQLLRTLRRKENGERIARIFEKKQR